MVNETKDEIYDALETLERRDVSVDDFRRTYGLVDGIHLMEQEYPPVSWLVDEIVPVGLGILGGRPKIGKSWLALQLARSVVTGRPFLGKETKPGKTLYLALEDPMRRLDERMKKQQWPTDPGIRRDFLAIVMGTYTSATNALGMLGVEYLGNIIEMEKPALVVVDTFSQITRADQIEHAQMMEVLQPLQETAHRENTAIVLVDHLRKSKLSQDELDIVEEILGSTAKAAAVDTTWGLFKFRGNDVLRFSIKGKEVLLQDIFLEFDALSGSWVVYEGLTEEMSVVYDVIAKAEAKLSTTEIADILKMNRGSVHRSLQRLVKEGKVTKTGNGRHGTLYGRKEDETCTLF